MARPMFAQLAYGTATVVCATFAMLLLSQARSTLAVLAVAVTALAAGLLVGLALRLPRRPDAPHPAPHPADRSRTPHVPVHH